MKKDIILAGVGGQGILTIATIIGDAAAQKGINLKQAEVHGMSQRGGDVQSNLRLSHDIIYSDLISLGTADIIISMEPLEALRYSPYLGREGWIITSSTPFVNISNYPDVSVLMDELTAKPQVLKQPIDILAKDNGVPKCANIILLGMAAHFIEILTPEELYESVERVFATKGVSVVQMNQQAFTIGYNIVKDHENI